MADKFWIQKVAENIRKQGTEGALRRTTKTKEGKNIPVSKLDKLASSGTALQKKRAQFALNVRH